jgi:hypothetical protein
MDDSLHLVDTHALGGVKLIHRRFPRLEPLRLLLDEPAVRLLRFAIRCFALAMSVRIRVDDAILASS